MNSLIIRNIRDVKMFINNLLNLKLISKKLRNIIFKIFIEYFKYVQNIPYIEINYSVKLKEIDRYRNKIEIQNIIISFNYDNYKAIIKIFINNGSKSLLINRSYNNYKNSCKSIYDNRYIKNTHIYVEKKLLQLFYYLGLR